MLNPSDLEADQLEAIAFLDGAEDSLLAADVGTGKTVIAATSGANALDAGDVKRWLIAAPTLVALDTWPEEFKQWEHLQRRSLAVAVGDETERRAAVESGSEFTVINYENLNWLLETYPKRGRKDTLPFDGIIYDELDKLKSVSSGRFKALRNRLGIFNKRIGMTGTLVPNDLTEAWGQVYMVDGGASFKDVISAVDSKRLARSFDRWRRHYFYPTDYDQHNWAPHHFTETEILDRIEDLCFRLPAKGLPKVITHEPHKMRLPPHIMALYRELEKEFYLLVKDDDGKNREVDAGNAAIAQGKLQQICAGFSYVDRTSEAVWHSRDRFEWLHRQLLPQLDGEQVLIFYHFREELDELKRMYPGIPYLGGGVSNSKKVRAIRGFNNREFDKIALHPASAGHGLNLQKSGAHNIAMLTTPWSGGLFTQLVGRLARRGNPAKEIHVHSAAFDQTVDYQVFNTVTGRIAGMQDFLDKLYVRTRLGRRDGNVTQAKDFW